MNRSSIVVSKAFKGIARTSSRVRAARPAPGSAFHQHISLSSSLLVTPSTGNIVRSFSSSADTLADILARELAEEKEYGRDQMPEELTELKSTVENEWKIVDDGATTRLFRSVGASKVVITFHCQDTVDQDADYLPEDEDDEPAVPFRYEILVSKAGNTLVLNCLSSGGETLVDGAALSTEDMESIQSNGIGRNQYQGPEFPELAEDLQEAFQEFVYSDLGVNEDVSAFISMYADYKEQLSYVGFLENVSKVLP